MPATRENLVIARWKAKTITLKACFGLYKRLGVGLDARDTRGESEYSGMLPVQYGGGTAQRGVPRL